TLSLPDALPICQQAAHQRAARRICRSDLRRHHCPWICGWWRRIVYIRHGPRQSPEVELLLHGLDMDFLIWIMPCRRSCRPDCLDRLVLAEMGAAGQAAEEIGLPLTVPHRPQIGRAHVW